MERPISNQQTMPVIADFFAQGYRVSGTFVGAGRSISDMIYDLSTAYLQVRDAYLSPITDPAKIGAHYASTTLAKSRLDFVLTAVQKDGLRRDQRFALGNYTFDLCLTVPFFEIQGRLHSLTRGFDPRVFLSSEAGPFITLLDVTARCTFHPDVTYQGGAAIISRAQISFLGEIQSESASQ